MTGRRGASRAVRPDPPGLSDVLTGLSRENSVYRRTIAVCDQLADAVMTGAGSTELTGVFAALVDKRVVLLDSDFRPRAQSGGEPAARPLRWNRSDRSIERLLQGLQAERRPLRVPSVPGSLLEQSCLIAPVAVGEATLGYLLVLDDPAGEPDDVDLLTTTYAATLFALTLAHERTSTQLGLRYQRAVVDALVSGHFLDAEDARTKARSLGLAENQGFRVGVLRPGPDADDARGRDAPSPEELVERTAGCGSSLVAAARDGGVVALIPEEPGESDADMVRRWQQVAPDLAATGGLSERLDAPDRAPHGFRQAEQAINLGIRLGRAGQVICYGELGIYRLLLGIGDLRELWHFAEDILGELVRYDQRHKLDLVHTLSVYLRHHGSLKQSARTLRLHPNTVAYRAQRIEQLTGLQLADPDDRLVAHVAVKIIEAHQSRLGDSD